MSRDAADGGPSLVKPALGYGALLLGAVLAFLWIRSRGLRLLAPEPQGPSRLGAAHTSESVDVLFHVLLALLVILIAAHAVGLLFRRIGQPPVIGEVVSGILLGPS